MTNSLSGKSIGVLLMEHDPTGDTALPYIGYLGKIWSSWGADFRFYKGTQSGVPEVDLLIAHLDITVIPDDYLALLEQHPNVVNGAVTDISKRRISNNLLQRDDDWRGRVIVKTNLNFGGLPELNYAQLDGLTNQELNDVQRPWRRVETLHPSDYTVFGSLAEVPPGVWRNQHLVVEKFIPEMDGENFCIRVTNCMGDQCYSRRIWSREPVVNSASILKVRPTETPDEIEAIRSRFGLQFGKMDYVMHDDQVHLFDLNTTPGTPPDTNLENPGHQALARGIMPLLNPPLH